MNGTDVETGAAEALGLLEAYLRERVIPHPILNRFLPRAAIFVTGSVALGAWDEDSDLDIGVVLPDEDHAALAAALREASLWDPARDFRLRLPDREPFRRFPGAGLSFLSLSGLAQQLRFNLPVALWVQAHAAVLQDPLGALATTLPAFRERFRASLDDLRCEHYYLFRQARNDLASRNVPRRPNTVLAIKRGETVREALRLAFLAEGRPYPYDKWLEIFAERETRAGASIVPAVRALLAASRAETVEHTSKVLRDRVIFALQQGGVSERWLEQWWLWPSVAGAASAPDR
jgi:hypothetical protein